MPRMGPRRGATFAVRAPDKARGRGVVVIQEWWGLVDHVKRVADKFALEGFHALAPDPLPRHHHEGARRGRQAPHGAEHRAGRGPPGRHRAPAVPHRPGGRHRGLLHGRRPEPVRGLRQPEGRRCLCRLLRRAPEGLVRLRPPRGAVPLAHWAEDDDFANPNASRFEAELGQRDKAYESHAYPGTQHAFFNDDRPEVYDRDAAVRSWERTIDHLARNL